jgi:hypothetical protein
VRRAVDERAGALDLLEEALLGELAQRLAHRHARHRELLGELALAGQRVAMSELAADDQAAHVARELKVERERQLAGQGVLVESSRFAHASLRLRRCTPR